MTPGLKPVGLIVTFGGDTNFVESLSALKGEILGGSDILPIL